jgi:hypothetical protein
METDYYNMHNQSEVAFRATLSLVVLTIGITCANVVSLPIDIAPFASRLTHDLTRTLFTAGYVLQIGTCTWLALSLLLDVTRGLRLALYSWFASMGLYLVPVPTLAQDAGAAALPLVVVGIVALIGWALDDSLRERAT